MTDEASQPPLVPPRRYGGKTADERRALRRDRLIDAGTELFGTLGFHGTSIRSVLRESGLGERYFYESFESLEDLLVAVAARAQNQIKTAAIQAMEKVEEPTFERILRAALTAVGEELSADPRVQRIAMVETIGVSRGVTSARDRLLEDFAGLIVGATVDFGEIPIERAHLLSFGLLGAANELLLRWAGGQLDADLPTVIAHIEMIFRGTYLLAAAPDGSRADEEPSVSA